MTLGQLVVFIVLFFALAYGAYLLITSFITDPPAQKIVLAVVGTFCCCSSSANSFPVC